VKACELVEFLQSVEPTYEVVLAADGEGNSLSPLDSTATCLYVPMSDWSGEIVDEGPPNAVVLWPAR
jgi:hypothetical protein